MQRREVILARVFFSDSNDSKIRPAIILSKDEYNKTAYVLVASITTSGDDCCIPILEADVNCQLDKNSGASFDGIIKLHKNQIVKVIGKITPEFYAKLRERIMELLN